jgi:hypothetical protein
MYGRLETKKHVDGIAGAQMRWPCIVYKDTEAAPNALAPRPASLHGKMVGFNAQLASGSGAFAERDRPTAASAPRHNVARDEATGAGFRNDSRRPVTRRHARAAQGIVEARRRGGYRHGRLRILFDVM